MHKQLSSLWPTCFWHVFLSTDAGTGGISSLFSDNRPRAERPKSLDLSGERGCVRLAVPLLGSARQNPLGSDRLHGVEEEDAEAEKHKALAEDSAGRSAATQRTGFDPLSEMATATERERDGDSSRDSDSSPTNKRNLVEEIETYINNSSPLSSRTPSVDLQNPSSPLFRSTSSAHTSPQSATLSRSNTHLSLPVKSKDRLRPSPSLPLGMCSKDRERPSSLISPSSPTPSSSSSFSMDSLLTPTLDIFKSSVISAGKGVAEKASRLYSRLSSQTSLTQVRHKTCFNTVCLYVALWWTEITAFLCELLSCFLFLASSCFGIFLIFWRIKYFAIFYFLNNCPLFISPYKYIRIFWILSKTLFSLVFALAWFLFSCCFKFLTAVLVGFSYCSANFTI